MSVVHATHHSTPVVHLQQDNKQSTNQTEACNYRKCLEPSAEYAMILYYVSCGWDAISWVQKDTPCNGYPRIIVVRPCTYAGGMTEQFYDSQSQ